MTPIPVIAIFDIGKTNKKVFLISENYQILWENTVQLTETTDEDGFACENIDALTNWVRRSIQEIFLVRDFCIKAINFSTYGASFVHVNKTGKVVAPLYNYLKPYPENLTKQFYATYNTANDFALITASPMLGSLNSGLQLYRLKYERPEVLKQIHYSLHLPQYVSFLITKQVYADITSIGCHTGLWNFITNDYHEWLKKEELDIKLPKLFSSEHALRVTYNNQQISVGIGLHDSSAALIPYITSYDKPFVLISTGTWCISLNPFNKTPLTHEELLQDSLCYMQYNGNPVKASRLFAGYEHEQQTKRIAAHFNVGDDFYKLLQFDNAIVEFLRKANNKPVDMGIKPQILASSVFADRSLGKFDNCETAYHQLMIDIIEQQTTSTNLVINEGGIKMIFVDGGFSSNAIYMKLLSIAYPNKEVYASTIAQSTAIGAALAIHTSWNKLALPADIIDLKRYMPL